MNTMKTIEYMLFFVVVLALGCSARKIVVNDNDLSSSSLAGGISVGVGKYDVTGPAAESMLLSGLVNFVVDLCCELCVYNNFQTNGIQ